MKAQGPQSNSVWLGEHEKAFANFEKNWDKILSELHIWITQLTLNNYVPKRIFIFHNYFIICNIIYNI